MQRASFGSANGGSRRAAAAAAQTISSLYALINAQVTIPGSGQGQPATTYTSPMSDTGSIQQYLPMILDKLTTKKTANLPARINVNTAPSAVLSALAPNGTPLLDAATVQSILATRPSTSTTDAPDPIFQTPAWLITQANVPVATVQSLEQYITARSQVFRVQSLGHFDTGGPTARVEAVIDTNAGRPRIVYYRDLTGLGKGFNLPTPTVVCLAAGRRPARVCDPPLNGVSTIRGEHLGTLPGPGLGPQTVARRSGETSAAAPCACCAAAAWPRGGAADGRRGRRRRRRLKERLAEAKIPAAPVLACLGRERIIVKDIRYPGGAGARRAGRRPLPGASRS